MKIGVLFGGRSVEHDISVISAASVATALASKGHSLTYIAIDKEGQWHLMESVTSPSASNSKGILRLIPGGGAEGGLLVAGEKDSVIKLDIIFPVLHGMHGEDGRIQGTLDTCAIPYVGAGVTPSVLTNDKDITKRLLREAGISTARSITVRKKNDKLFRCVANDDKASTSAEYKKVTDYLKLPFWIKPANLGSSLGISRVRTEKDFVQGIQDAFALDDKIIIEEHVEGREMECSVMENDQGIVVSLPGEIVLKGHTFYDYDAKYVEEDGARLIIPAEVSDDLAGRIKDIALKVFHILENRHIMRLDIFVVRDESGKQHENILVNEVQTIPGFTSISMYPKLLEVAGISLPELVDGLANSVPAINRP